MLALIPLRDAMGVPGTLLLLLVGPVAVAVLGGLLPAIAASLVTFLLADWFYIAPTHSFRFAHAGDALALVVFVAVSALVSVLVDRLASRSAQLARGQAEIEALAELASVTAVLDDEAQHRLVTELRPDPRPRLRGRARTDDRRLAQLWRRPASRPRRHRTMPRTRPSS